MNVYKKCKTNNYKSYLFSGLSSKFNKTHLHSISIQRPQDKTKSDLTLQHMKGNEDNEIGSISRSHKLLINNLKTATFVIALVSWHTSNTKAQQLVQD